MGAPAYAYRGKGTWMWPVNGTITSFSGWRTHPVFGTQRYHSGMDIGCDYNDTICAAEDGTIQYAGWAEGYGNVVYIDHGNGSYGNLVSIYGHNTSVLVSNGQRVTRGTPIALAGSTGYSTGPHCHFEVRADGSYTPAEDFLPNVPNAASNGAYGTPGFIWDGSEYPWGIESMYTIGDTLNKIMEEFATGIKKGFGDINALALGIISALMIIDLCWLIIKSGFALSVAALISKLTGYCFILFLLLVWQKYIVDGIFIELILDASEALTGDVSIVKEQVSQPQLLLQKAIFLLTPALNKAASYSMPRFFVNARMILPLLLVSLLTMGIFTVSAISVALNYIEFYLCAAFNVVSLPFLALTETASWPQGNITGLIKATLRLLITAFILYIMFTVLKDAKPGAIFVSDDITSDQLIKFLVMNCSLCALALLVIIIPRKVVNYLEISIGS